MNGALIADSVPNFNAPLPILAIVEVPFINGDTNAPGPSTIDVAAISPIYGTISTTVSPALYHASGSDNCLDSLINPADLANVCSVNDKGFLSFIF